MSQITIIGGGSWGTALAQTLANKNHQVLIYVRDNNLKENINQNQINHQYFPQITLNKNIKATTRLRHAVIFSRILFITVPTAATRQMITQIKPDISQEQIVVSTAKGIEENSFMRNSEIIGELIDNQVAILSGPTHSEEVIKLLPSAAVIAASKLELAQKIQAILMSPNFRIYTNLDAIGVELGGAVKNIIAIAAGIVEGLGYGDNTRAALITRGLSEIRRLGIHLGGNPLTFSGLAGLGDLVVTCNSLHSRNYRFGIEIGKGLSLTKALDKIKQTVEGVKTTKAIYYYLKQNKNNFDLPITNQIYQVLFNNKKPRQAVDELMVRDPKQELLIEEIR